MLKSNRNNDDVTKTSQVTCKHAALRLVGEKRKHGFVINISTRQDVADRSVSALFKRICLRSVLDMSAGGETRRGFVWMWHDLLNMSQTNPLDRVRPRVNDVSLSLRSSGKLLQTAAGSQHSQSRNLHKWTKLYAQRKKVKKAQKSTTIFSEDQFRQLQVGI